MKMINASNDTIRVPSELFAKEAWDGPNARPTAPVPVEPGDIVLIDDHYALPSRLVPAHFQGTGARTKSAVEKLCPQLKPYDDAAKELFATKTLEDLDDVRRTFAELERAGKASAGTVEDAVTAARIEKGIRDGLAHALGHDKPKPMAKLKIEKTSN
jgi:hypothetical protein